jgi:hypothetical protein
MTYTPPEVRDYGTLLEVTAELDVAFVGAMTNVVMAALSAPIGGEVRGDTEDFFGNGGGGSLGAGDDVGGGGAGEALATGDPGAGGTRLPFTGFPVAMAAGIGAAFVTFGAAARSALRRRPPGD